MQTTLGMIMINFKITDSIFMVLKKKTERTHNFAFSLKNFMIRMLNSSMVLLTYLISKSINGWNYFADFKSLYFVEVVTRTIVIRKTEKSLNSFRSSHWLHEFNILFTSHLGCGLIICFLKGSTTRKERKQNIHHSNSIHQKNIDIWECIATDIWECVATDICHLIGKVNDKWV